MIRNSPKNQYILHLLLQQVWKPNWGFEACFPEAKAVVPTETLDLQRGCGSACHTQYDNEMYGFVLCVREGQRV